MRRKIELYVNGKRADLDEKGLLLYNYAFTDLEMPTAVKNSFSKQVTLPATPRNLALFGHPQRTDRAIGSGGTGVGVDFHPGEKTPFELRNELGERLESGYLRLDAATVNGRVVTGLQVTLFGGLGSFFYNLSYTEDGEKKTLGDLDHGVDLSDGFTINAIHVQWCWDRLAAHDQSEGIEVPADIVNFAPCYNGLPSGDFSPDKALVATTAAGLADSVEEGGVTYEDKDGVTLVSLKEARDEWAMKDLRSYLQRPVYSMTAFLQAICNPDNNGGFSVDISQIPEALYVNLWKTLPMLSQIGGIEEQTGSSNLLDGTVSPQTDNIGVFTGAPTIPLGAQLTVELTTSVSVDVGNGLTGLTPVLSATFSGIGGGGYYRFVLFMQLVGRDEGASEAVCVTGFTDKTAAEIAQICGYTPKRGAGIELRTKTMQHDTGTKYCFNEATYFELSGGPETVFNLEYACYIVTTTMQGDVLNVAGTTLGVLDASGHFYAAVDLKPKGYTSAESWTVTGKVRSGAMFDYANVLASKYTPAEYLLSFCKLNGLVFLYDPAAKHVTILPRNAFFTGDTVDLSGRIDRSKENTVKPLAMKAKWYELKGDAVKGAFFDGYAKKYGVDYAIQRVNTGYDFDAAAEDVMKGVVFRGAVSLLDFSPYWNIITDDDGHCIPSAFLDRGATYLLWDADGQSKEFPVPDLTDVTINYYNGHTGYDAQYCPKLELRNADNKGVDGEDVLCFYRGAHAYAWFALTDDTIQMLNLNEKKPCWNLADIRSSEGLSVPVFHRYNAINRVQRTIVRSLDYGIPKEVNLPDVTFNGTTGSVYLRSWRAYLSDLLDKDTKVMKCRVHLSGLQVGPELLRRFWWYEGSVWVLNKISNYSLTTWDPVECEFVQVRDTANYTNGQNL